MSLFPNIVCIVAVFSLYGEDVVRFSFSGGIYLPCDHELDFFTPAYVRSQSINQIEREGKCNIANETKQVTFNQ